MNSHKRKANDNASKNKRVKRTKHKDEKLQEKAEVQLKAMIACQSILKRKEEISEPALQQEMNISSQQWHTHKQEIMELVDGIPLVPKVTDRPSDTQQVIVLCGIPGSGKTTFAERLAGKGWERVNQDELGSRKKVENKYADHLRGGKSVIVDRCNFDYKQRHTWIKIAEKYEVKWITCIYFKIETRVCKQRAAARKNHPSFPSGKKGMSIIDRFSRTWVSPRMEEGFCEVLELSTDDEVESAYRNFRSCCFGVASECTNIYAEKTERNQ